MFADNHARAPLSDVESFIFANRHLPGIAPARDMQAEGGGVTDLTMRLLEKVEELTLLAIRQEWRVGEFETRLRTRRSWRPFRDG